MDLPTCPSCGQSVLDDEAVDCPFCGSSMSARPGAKAARPAASKPAPEAEKPAARKPAAKAEKPAAPGSDDPFGTAAQVGRKAIPLLAKPVAGKLHRVICPMCESPGFGSKQIAGKEVRCANSECLMPVFTAPPIETEKPVAAPEPEAPPKKLGAGAYAGIAAVTAILLAGIAWFFMDSGPKRKGNEFDPSKYANTGGDTDVVVANNNDDVTPPANGEGKSKTETPEVKAGPTAADYQREAMELLAKYSLETDRNNQKPFCRQMSAEAAVQIGDLARANDELTQLDRVRGNSLAYFRILPLTMLGWHHLKAGDSAAAGKLATEAMNTEGFPRQGMTALDNAVELAALLVALDRNADAKKLLTDRLDNTEAGVITGALMVSLHRSKDTGMPFDQVVSLRPASGWELPSWSAVTISLVAHGAKEQALNWAKQADSEDVKADALSAWAEGQVHVSDAGAIAAVQTALADVSADVRARILARCSLVLALRGNATQAEAVLVQAREVLGTKTPEPAAFPEVRKPVPVALPDPQPLRQKALAYAEVAHALAQLKKTTEAETALEQSMACLRAMAPSLTQAQQPVDEINRQGADGIAAQLRKELNLLTDDDARNAYTQYRKRCLQVLEAATARFQFQQRIMRSACDWGLAEFAWKEMKQRATEQTVALNEPWLDTQVASVAHSFLDAAGRTTEAEEIQKLVGEERLKKNADIHIQLHLRAEKLAAGSDFIKVADVLHSLIGQKNVTASLQWQQESLLQLTSRLTNSGKHGEAFQLATAIQDGPTRTLVYERVAAETAARGDFPPIMDAAKRMKSIPPDRVAILRGLIEGLPSASTQAAATAPGKAG